MGPGKVRIIREGIAALLNQADRGFLTDQKNSRTFAEGIAWELANAGYCSQDEYEREVLPYLLEEREYLNGLRVRILHGDEVTPDDVGLFSDMLKAIGKEIRQARLKRGWTQAQLAEAAGTFQPIVSRVEQGRTLKQPTIELLDRFAQALGRRIVLTLTEPE